MMNYKPLFDKVLVAPTNNENVVDGLIIPDVSSNLKKGIVVSSGDDTVIVKKDSTVLFMKDVGIPIVISGHQYLIMGEKDVWLHDV